MPPAARPDRGAQLGAALTQACEQAGLSHTGARLLAHRRSAAFHLPGEDAVARVTLEPHAADRLTASFAAVQQLTEYCPAATAAPLPGVPPVTLAAGIVTFWRYYPQLADVPPPGSAELGEALRQVHTCSAPPNLPTWTPLASLHSTVVDGRQSPALTQQERSWLLSRIAELRQEISTLEFPLGTGLLHGDAWAGNLLWRRQNPDDLTAILCDWDNISVGPREVDLIPTWHAATRYGRGPGWIRSFVRTYGTDISGWTGLRVFLDMRDLVQITGLLHRALDSPQHLVALRQRLDGVRAGDHTTVWAML